MFLPIAGVRNPNLGSYSANSFTYATGTYSDSYEDYRMCSIFDLFYAATQDGIGSADYMMGTSVRLVKDYYGSSTAIDDVQDNVQCTKVIRDGQLLITRDGRTYNALGVEVK